jgi:hypothetical protein
MARGWEVELHDGTILCEDSSYWNDVPKVQIKRLTLLFDTRRWDLINKQAYFIRNTASVVPGSQESFRIEKRGIGYYEGSTKVLYTVNESTGEFKMLVEGPQ